MVNSIKNTVLIRILIAADDLKIRAEITNVLQGKDIISQQEQEYEWILCRPGDEAVKAVKKARDQGKPFAIAFFDIEEPKDLKRIQTVKKIREQDPYIQIVLLTSFAEHTLAETRSMRVPSDQHFFYLQKPFHPYAVSHLAITLRAKWVQENAFRQLNVELAEKYSESHSSLRETTVQLTSEMIKLTLAEEAAHQMEEKIKKILAASPLGVQLFRLDDMWQLVLIGFNGAADNIFGIDHSVLIGKFIEEVVPSPLGLELKKNCQLIAKRGRSYQTELYFNKGHQERAVELYAFQTENREMAIMYLDITQRKLAEQALQESEEKYRLLAENITDVIWAMDMNLQVTYVSPSVTRLRGYSVEEAMAQRIEEMLTPDSIELALEVFAQELAIEQADTKDLSRSRMLELTQTCKDGSTVTVEVKMSFLRNERNQAIGISGITRDVSERKKNAPEK